MRPRALPLLLVLLLLAVPAAMLVYVGVLDPAGEVGPAPPGPGGGPGGAARPASAGVAGGTAPAAAARAAAPRSRPTPGPATAAATPQAQFPPVPPVDSRFAVQVSGRVLDPAGAPLAGARVRALLQRSAVSFALALADDRGTSRYLLAAEQRTDEAGRFTLAGLDPDLAYLLVISHSPFQALVTPLQPLDPGRSTRLGDLRLEAGFTATGTCRDPEGRPLAGVHVLGTESKGFSMSRMYAAHPLVATSGADGGYRLEGLPRGEIRLQALTPGRVGMERELQPDESDRVMTGVDFVLTKGLSLAGRVVGSDGVGLAGVLVTAMMLSPPEGLSRPARQGGARTDAEGRFSITGVPAGMWHVAAEMRGLRRASVRTGAGTTDIRLVLEPARVFSLRGVVVVHGSGAPIEGARVGLGTVVSRRHVGAAAEVAAVTGADGTFQLEVAEQPLPRWVMASAEGFVPGQSAAIELKQDSAEPPVIRLHLQPATGVSGRVTKAGGGDGIEGATVHLYPAAGADRRVFRAVMARYGGARAAITRAATDASGAFVISGVPPGVYELEARAPGRAPGRLTDVRLEPGAVRADVLIPLGVGGAFTGSVRYRDGSPARNYVVSITHDDGSISIARVGESGDFTFEHLVPGGYQVRVAQPEVGSSQPWSRQQAEAGEIAITPGGRVTRVFTVERGVRVHGTVRSQGAPCAQCEVLLIPLRGGNHAPGAAVAFTRSHRATSAANGGYVFAAAPPGRARISVRAASAHGAQGVAALEREVTVPRQPDWTLDLDLPGGALRGRVLLPPGVARDAGRPRLRLTCAEQPRLKRSAFAAADGAFQFGFLAPGDYLVHVFADEHWGAAERRVKVGPNAVVSGVEIALAAGVEVLGVVVTEDGKPAELAQVRVQPAGPDDGRGVVELRSGAYGKFKILALQPGRYTFFARKGALQSASTEISVPPGGRDDIRIVVKPVRR